MGEGERGHLGLQGYLTHKKMHFLQVFAMGEGEKGQLGLNDPKRRDYVSPVEIEYLTNKNVFEVAAGMTPPTPERERETGRERERERERESERERGDGGREGGAASKNMVFEVTAGYEPHIPTLHSHRHKYSPRHTAYPEFTGEPCS